MTVSTGTPFFVDARKAEGQLTGVGHYSAELLSEFTALGAPHIRLSGAGLTWHIRTAIKVIRHRSAKYFSPESLIVPFIVGRRAVITVHDISPITHPSRHTRRNLLVHKLLLRATLRRVSSVIVPSEAVKRDIEAFDPAVASKLVVIHEGYRFGWDECPFAGRASRTVSYLGSVEPRKNVTTLCRAFSAANDGSWKLQIAGKMGWLNDDERAEFFEAIEDPNIAYLGYIEDSKVPDLFRETALFAYVSEAEGFGLPPLEAMSFGVPVLVSDDPALLEVVGGAASVLPLGPDFSKRLQERLRDLFDHPEKLESMAERGRLRAADFSWTMAARVTLGLLQQKSHP